MIKPFTNRRGPLHHGSGHGVRRPRRGRRAPCDERAARVEHAQAPAFARLFVCDTLMAGERYHHLLGAARRVAAHVRTRSTFRLLDRGGLADLAAAGETAVLGEVYEVDASTLAGLDRGFGHPRIYSRTSIGLEDGTAADAYLTTRARPGDPEIESGDWRAREEAYATWAVRAGDHEIIGTRLEIVRALQDLLLDGEGFSMRQYIDWVVTNARKELGIELDVRGDTDEDVADSYLKAMLRANLIRRC